MPICIECGYPVSELYHVLRSNKSAAPTPKPSNPNLASTSNSRKIAANASTQLSTKPKATTGGDVRLTQCPRCKRFADKYVEHDYVILFIDLVLVKPQVYRHLLFNRLSRDDDDFDPSILRLGTLLLLFDVYLTWSHVEQLLDSLPSSFTLSSPIPTLPVPFQYAFYLFFCGMNTLSQHLTIRWLASLWKADEDSNGRDRVHNYPSGDLGTQPDLMSAPPKRPTPNAISTALFVSSCMSLFPILMVVWKYDDAPESSVVANRSLPDTHSMTFGSGFLSSQGPGVDWVRRGVAWAVAVQNLEALRILLGCGYPGAAVLVIAGGMVRWVIKSAILRVVGLGEIG